ncbi:MAG: hypothetical protein HY897_23170 [Deltaproteobacteria bacterium]|nr:hypothetical protein [Deltaproteobacteria bacterium]
MPVPAKFFDLTGSAHGALFIPDQPVWTALDRLGAYLAGYFGNAWPLKGRTGLVAKAFAIVDGQVREDVEVRQGKKGNAVAFAGGVQLGNAAIVMAGTYLFDDRVILGPGTVVEPGALIKGPAVIGANTGIRQGAYLRGDCLAGDGCIIGHTTEMKSSIMLDGAKAGHFAYVGDSILGRDVNLGAGTKLANLRMIPGAISVRGEKGRIDTGRRKLGAILGDGTETGCNSVTSPGTLTGPRSVIYPAVAVPPGIYPGQTHFRPPQGSPVIRSTKT